MFKRVFSFMLSSALCIGVGCVVTVETHTTLNQADGLVTISQPAGAAEVTVVATITDSSRSPARTVVLEEGQAISVNDLALSGPDASGQYARTVPVAAAYKFTVNEPTHGVQDTTIAAPGPSDITAPLAGSIASLSGFTVTWSNPDPALQVRVQLLQTIFGGARTQDFGPFPDTGTLLLGPTDLSKFQQGANLLITVTRIRQIRGINGLKSGTLSAEQSQAVTVTPGP